jgi:hypothetical protein
MFVKEKTRHLRRAGRYGHLRLGRHSNAGPRSRPIPVVNILHLDITVSLYQPGDMRTTVTLDRDVYDAATHLSRVSGERLGKVLSDLARRGLRQAPPSRRAGNRRFPTFDVPQGAPVIPAARIQKVIDEEEF